MVSATYFWQYETTVFGNQLLDKLEGVTKSLAQGLCEEVKQGFYTAKMGYDS